MRVDDTKVDTLIRRLREFLTQQGFFELRAGGAVRPSFCSFWHKTHPSLLVEVASTDSSCTISVYKDFGVYDEAPLTLHEDDDVHECESLYFSVVNRVKAELRRYGLLCGGRSGMAELVPSVMSFIDSLDICSRSRNCLKHLASRHGLNYAADLGCLSIQQVACGQNIGPLACQEISEALFQHGIILRNDKDYIPRVGKPMKKMVNKYLLLLDAHRIAETRERVLASRF